MQSSRLQKNQCFEEVINTGNRNKGVATIFAQYTGVRPGKTISETLNRDRTKHKKKSKGK